jgi:thioredoxin 1
MKDVFAKWLPIFLTSQLIVLLSLVVPSKEDSPSGSKLSFYELNDENFSEYLNKHEYLAVYFHATYSDESKTLQNQFKKIPYYLETNSSFNLAYGIITQKAYQTNHKYNVDFPYPKIFLITKETYWEYKGEMKAETIADWMDKKLHKKIHIIENVEDLTKQMTEFDRIVCLVNLQLSNYGQLIDTFNDLHFYQMTNQTLIDTLNIESKYKNSEPKIIIFKNYDERISIYSGDTNNFTKIENFIKAYTYPLVNKFTSTNYLYAVNNRLTFSVMLFNGNDSLLEEFKESATKLRGNVFFMHGNLSEQSQTTLAIDFEVKEEDLPVIVIQDYSSKDKTVVRYKLSQIHSESSDKVSEFFLKYKYNALRRFLKSQNEPSQVLNGNIFNLVRSNFNRILVEENEDKYALVYFERRNCGPCLELKKDFIKLSERFNDNNIIFGIIDGLQNEFDEFEILGYPSVVLFKPG